MIQEKVIYTENGFHLKSDFTKNVIYTDNSSTRYFKKQLSDSLWVTKHRGPAPLYSYTETDLPSGISS